jgi:rod shape-determining protein MreC
MLENAVNAVVSPIQNGITYLKNKINGNTAFFADINELKEENEELKKENELLKQSERQLEVLQSENTVLKESLKLTEKYPDYETVAGLVISRDITNYSKTVVINVGKNDGVEENMMVIASEGLVGYVLSVTNDTAKVQTIVDSSSSTSVIASESNESFVCKGTLEDDSTLKAMYISDISLSEGEEIRTSGLGGIYKKGILIGTVSKVVSTNNKTDKYAYVKTAVDFTNLESVLVIKN